MTQEQDKFDVSFTYNGYVISVAVNLGAIKRHIQRVEDESIEQINKHGSSAFDASKYTTVAVEPTEEKWAELADGESPDEEGSDESASLLEKHTPFGR